MVYGAIINDVDGIQFGFIIMGWALGFIMYWFIMRAENDIKELKERLERLEESNEQSTS